MKPSMRAEYKNAPRRYKFTWTHTEDPRSTEELVRLQAFFSDDPSDNLEEAMKLCWNQKP